MRTTMPVVAALILLTALATVIESAPATSAVPGYGFAPPPTIRVVVTAWGPFMCGPAFAIEGIQRPYQPALPFDNVPAMTPADRWYDRWSDTGPVPAARPWMNTQAFLPPNPARPDQIRCKPLFTPQAPRPMLP